MKRDPNEAVNKPYWKEGDFHVAVADGRLSHKTGTVRAGLGVYAVDDQNANIVHVNSGHTILRVAGTVQMAQFHADTIAKFVPWEDFETPDGWVNYEPELPTKVRQYARRFRALKVGGGGEPDHDASHKLHEARMVAQGAQT